MKTPSSFPWRFFLMTYALSWGMWIPAALMGQPALSMPAAPLYMLGGFAPSIVGIFLIMREGDRSARRDVWRRAFSFRTIRPAWYLWIFLLVPLVTTLAYLLGGAKGLPAPLTTALAQPVMLFGTAIMAVFTGPLAEEFGWRGYALDRLQARWSPAAASLVLGLVWWAWHLPLFFIQGTSHHSWGIFSLPALLFLLNVIPLSLFMTLAYNQNNRSILSAILIHWVFNLVYSLIFPVPQHIEWIRFALFALISGGLWVWYSRSKGV